MGSSQAYNKNRKQQQQSHSHEKKRLWPPLSLRQSSDLFDDNQRLSSPPAPHACPTEAPPPTGASPCLPCHQPKQTFAFYFFCGQQAWKQFGKSHATFAQEKEKRRGGKSCTDTDTDTDTFADADTLTDASRDTDTVASRICISKRGQGNGVPRSPPTRPASPVTCHSTD